MIIRDRSFITGMGGLHNGRGRGKLYPYKKKRVGGRVLAMLKGGTQKVLRLFHRGPSKI